MLEQNLAHGAYLPEGWHERFEWLVLELHALDSTLEIIQAKEKFGELRIYLKTHTPEADEAIAFASRWSRRVCQVCGGEAVLRVSPDRLYRTLCHDHRGKFVPAKGGFLVKCWRMISREKSNGR